MLANATSSTAGASLDAPAGPSSNTAKGAGSGVPFDAVLDEQTQMDEAPAQDAGAVTTENAQSAGTGSAGTPLGSFGPYRTRARGGPADPDAEQASSISEEDAADEDVIDTFLTTTVPTLIDFTVPVDRGVGGGSEAPAARAEGTSSLPGADVQLPATLTAGVSARMALTAGVSDRIALPTAESTGAGEAKTAEQAGDRLPAQVASSGFEAPPLGAATQEVGRALSPASHRALADAARARLHEQLAAADGLAFAPAWERARAAKDLAARAAQDLAVNSATGAPAAAPPASSFPALPQSPSVADAFAARQSHAALAQMAAADAFRSSKDAGGFRDADPGSEQHAAPESSERTPMLAAGTVHMVQPVANFGATLGSVQVAADYAVPTIPNEAHAVSSIVQSMRLQMRDGIGTAVVNLEPEYLGPVTIALRVEAGVVTATLHAENPQVRAWMEANEPLLRQGLADQGLTLDKLIVSDARLTEEQRRSDRRRQQAPQEPPARRPRRDESRTFEVVV